MIAAKIANMRSGARTDLEPSANLHQVGNDEVSIEEAAAQVNVSERSVERAKKVNRDCIDELSAAVSSGEVKVSDAVKAADLPKAEQKWAVEMVGFLVRV